MLPDPTANGTAAPASPPKPGDVIRLLNLPTREDLAMALTPRQRAFAEAWVRHGNGRRAVREAGFTVKPGRIDEAVKRLKHSKRVRAYIARLVEDLADSKGIDRAWIRAKLKRVVDDEKVAAAAKVQALRLLGQDEGMFRSEEGGGQSTVVKVIVGVPPDAV